MIDYVYAVLLRNALVVDTADFDACVAAASELIENPALRARLRRAGFATAERYSIFQAALSEVTVFRDGLRARRQVWFPSDSLFPAWTGDRATRRSSWR